MIYQAIYLAVLGIAAAQTPSEVSANQTISAPAVFNGSMVPSPTTPVVQLNLNLEDVWDLLIGPVEVANTTTTYSPTPVPSSSLIPPPPIYYSPFPTGQQVPLVPKNESWSFPDDFWWGVAGAAFQVEGAAKDEGRGPSVWDALSRVNNHIVDNSTADVADNVSLVSLRCVVCQMLTSCRTTSCTKRISPDWQPKASRSTASRCPGPGYCHSVEVQSTSRQ